MSLQIGDKAPSFNLEDDQNKRVGLEQFRGQKVILYFYPKDNTPGCTKEACDFRDAFPQFKAAQAVVLGISKDSPATHAKFKMKHQLPFKLLSDPQAEVCEAYGVINPKSFFGKTFLGIQRSTFLIDEEGKIQGIWRKVKVPQHASLVLAEISPTS